MGPVLVRKAKKQNKSSLDCESDTLPQTQYDKLLFY